MTQTRSKVKTKSEEKCDAKELRGDKAEQYVIVQQRYGRYFWAHKQVPQTWGSQIRVAFPGVCTSRLAELKCTLQTRVVFLREMHGSPIGDRGAKTQAVFWVHAKPPGDAVNISDCMHR